MNAAELNAATAAARTVQAKAANAEPTGQLVTGTNAKPRASRSKTASAERARASKTTAAKGSTAAKPEKAARPVKIATPAPAGSSKYADQRVVAETLINLAAEMIKGWKPAEHEGITAEFAREATGRWLSYLPNCQWNDALGARSTAGRRPKAS
jgi:hypothetical protein